MMQRPTLPKAVVVVICAAAAFAMAAAPAAKPDAPASSAASSGVPAEVEEAFASGDCAKTLRLVSQALSFRGPSAARGAGRVRLLTIKGECLLRSKSYAYAADAFDAAAKAAEAAHDRAAADQARATMILIRRSPRGAYPAQPEPIEVTPPERRVRAMGALFENLSTTLGPKAASAAQADTLVPMLDLLPQLLDLRAVEVAATGADEKTRTALRAMGARARELMSKELARTAEHLQDLRAAADSVLFAAGGGVLTRASLTSDDKREAAEAIEYLERIARTARNARQLAAELGADPHPWEGIVADANDLADEARALIDRR